MKSLLQATIASFIIISAGNANATEQLYNVMEMYQDGAMFTGSYNFDTATDTLTNVQGSLTDSNGTVSLGIDYFNDPSVGIGGQQGGNNDTYDFAVNSIASAPMLNVLLDINNANGSVNFSTYFDATNPNGVVLEASTVTVTASVPEPAFLSLFVSGLMGVVAAARRKLQAA